MWTRQRAGAHCGHHLKDNYSQNLLSLRLLLIESRTLMERLISSTLDKYSSPRSSSHVVSFLVAIDPKIGECEIIAHPYHFSAENDFA
jgi:hypothetical protein